MGRGTGVGTRLLICFIAVAINILIHVNFLFVGLYYLAEPTYLKDKEATIFIKKNAGKVVPAEEVRDELKHIKSRVETGGVIVTIYSIFSLAVLAGVILLLLKKDPKLLRGYANGLGPALALLPILFELWYAFIWKGYFLNPIEIMCWLSSIGTSLCVASVERYRRELLMGGNVGGRNRGWATPRPDVEQNLSAANVNDQAAPAPNEAAAPEGDQNAGSA